MTILNLWCGAGRLFSRGFDSKVAIAIPLLLAIFLFGGSSVSADGPTEGKAASFEVSAPVRNLASSPERPLTGLASSRINPLAGEPDGGQRGTWDREQPPLDRLIRHSQNLEQETSAPDLVFDGISNPFACDGCTPPGAVGAAGPSHFVQMVNKTKVGIFAKRNGRLAVPAFDLGELWSSGPCSVGRGNPMVSFDSLAGRWILSQSAGQRHLCFAVSRGANPAGVYYLYTFNVGELPRDFKLGVWPSGYYVSANETTYTAYAFDRAKMLAGDANAKFVKFTGAPNLLLPANVDGAAAPDAVGGLFYTVLDDEFHGGRDRIELFELVPDFVTPAKSRFRLKNRIAIARFSYTVCGFFNLNCIRQRGTGRRLDAVSEWPMHRLAYRRIGGQESLLGNFTVGGGKGVVGAAIRWFELRNSPAGWILFQQGTHDPGDGLDRFMGSIAMDKDGNIALGYSASGSTAFPSIRYAMQFVGDPVGTLRQERVLKAGGGSQTGPNRWGSHSAMSVDPEVGCQFWYTNEYYSQSSRSNWKTAVGAFTAATCSATSGFPDATNTGIPPGTTLKASGGLSINTAGAVVSGLDITGSVTINAPNVTLRNCRVRGTSWGAIVVMASNVLIENCEIFSIANRGTKGIQTMGGHYLTVRRNNIHHVEDGIYLSGRGHVIEDNYIHDLHSNGSGPHYDGIQLVGGSTSDVTIRHNSVMLSVSTNAAITMGTVQNIVMDNNRLHGGGYTVVVDGRHGGGTVSNVSITNNRFGPHHFGYWTTERANPVFTGNVDDATGRSIR